MAPDVGRCIAFEVMFQTIDEILRIRARATTGIRWQDCFVQTVSCTVVVPYYCTTTYFHLLSTHAHYETSAINAFVVAVPDDSPAHLALFAREYNDHRFLVIYRRSQNIRDFQCNPRYFTLFKLDPHSEDPFDDCLSFDFVFCNPKLFLHCLNCDSEFFFFFETFSKTGPGFCSNGKHS